VTIPIAPAIPHTDAVVAAIAAVPILVGRGRKPDGAGWQGNPGTSSYVRYEAQINVFGATDGQAEGGADDVRSALIGRRLAVTGRSTYPVQTPGGPPTRRDESVTPPTYMAVVEIAFRSQPA
jgi:hypothetical protein